MQSQGSESTKKSSYEKFREFEKVRNVSSTNRD
jgi:hypothetical protein